MSGLLERIVASKRAEIAAMDASPPRRDDERATCDVPRALRKANALALIAEVKLRSPSAGELSHALDPATRAKTYAAAGAAMVSILCDQPFFGGSYDHVVGARAALDAAGFDAVPVLAKEFVLDDRQLAHARDAGADAALLIARILPGDALATLVDACRARRLEPFVEVADEIELARALAVNARVIGVNARDLDTLAMDAERTARVLDAIPRDVCAVHLSGLRSEADIGRAASGRADAALVGESLMRLDDPTDLLKRMLASARK